MNSKYLACLAALFISSIIASADIVYPMERADRKFDTTATEKLDRGISNLLMFPLEIPNTIWYNSARYNQQGFAKGASDGVRNAGVRLAQGVFDIATFPINTGNFEVPWDPPPPVVHPEWIPFVNYCVPWIDYVDQDHQEWIDGWESQRYP